MQQPGFCLLNTSKGVEYSKILRGVWFIIASIFSISRSDHWFIFAPLPISLCSRAFADLIINRYTPLHLAAHHGHLPIVEFLSNNGANREVLATHNRTPLHLAALNGHLPLVQFLLAMGVDVTVRQNSNHTALDLARIHRNNNPAIYDQIIAALEEAAPARRCVMM